MILFTLMILKGSENLKPNWKPSQFNCLTYGTQDFKYLYCPQMSKVIFTYDHNLSAVKGSYCVTEFHAHVDLTWRVSH
jgi:hypothetical protein